MSDPKHCPEYKGKTNPSADIKNPSRRDAIRYLIGGAVAAACPFPSELFASAGQSATGSSAAGQAPSPAASGATSASTPAKLGSESNEICHRVRDGEEFKFPAPSKEYEVIIVGGGPSGLLTSYKLRETNFLLLEKEPRFGGNAISEQWKGQWYSTGAAYQMNDALEALCRDIGMEIFRIRSVDAAIINDKLVPDFWTGGLWKSSYPDSVKKNFDKFFKDMKSMDLEANKEKLDNMSFAELLKPYGPELTAWFDNFGPNNWGAKAVDTSAYIGADSVNWGGGVEPERYTWPGGLGRISIALSEKMQQLAPGRLHNKTTVLQIEQKASKVQVSYMENGEIVTAAAKTVVVACPKFIGKKIVKGLDKAHFDAMDEMRYQPYLVVNVCSSQVIYNGSYDTNIPAPSPIVDFNVADWVINRDNKELNRPAVLTCYVPRPERERSKILHDDYCVALGQQVVEKIETWFPGAKARIEEVHIYRRGHPMYVSAPGVLTRVAPEIRKPMGNIFFGHSDSEGGISEYSTGLQAAERVSKEVMAALAKKA